MKVIKGLRDSRNERSQCLARVVNTLEQQILKTAFNKIGTVPAIVSQTVDAFERRALADTLNQWK